MCEYPLYSTARPSGQMRRSYFLFLHSAWYNQVFSVVAEYACRAACESDKYFASLERCAEIQVVRGAAKADATAEIPGKLMRDSFTMKELTDALTKCNPNKFPGQDGAGYGLYIESPNLHPFLLAAFNSVWSHNESIPSDWLKATIITLYKGKGDMKDIANRQPLTLLNCDYKLMAKMIATTSLWVARTCKSDILGEKSQNRCPLIASVFIEKEKTKMSNSKPIPTNRSDSWVPNPHNLSTTPGGTLYATTPGGTRIVYDREKLMALSQSPLSKSPINLPNIPGVTITTHPHKMHHDKSPSSSTPKPAPADAAADDEIFALDVK
jgi:hypothetical protein